MSNQSSTVEESLYLDPLLTGLLSSAPPNLSAPEAVAFLAEHYGVNADVREVACERDQNFYVRTDQGVEYVLKISNPGEPALITDFQTAGLAWIEKHDPALPVPKLVPTLAGDVQSRLQLNDGRECRVRVLTWLRGEALYRVPITPEMECALGVTLARLGLALAEFTHPGAHTELLWDIRHTARLRPLLAALPEDDTGAAVRRELLRYETHTLPKLSRLRHQVVHNDLNHHNVMVDVAGDGAISAVIDFGDMVDTCLAIDVAVAASYLADNPDDPLASVARLVGAYHQIRPLLAEEVMLLRDLIVARLITSITITGWRANRYPANAAYILRNNGPARRALAGFGSLKIDDVTKRLMSTCGLE